MTEPVYLKALAALPTVRESAALDIRGTGFDPRRLVAAAKKAKQSEPNTSGSGTEYWCVFDVEAPTPHHGLNDAVQMARDNGISVAISNPCFELWLILHLADHRRWVSNQDARTRRSELDGSTGKQLDSPVYMRNRDHAAQRAQALDAEHRSAQRVHPADNPSSGVHLLLTAIEP